MLTLPTISSKAPSRIMIVVVGICITFALFLSLSTVRSTLPYPPLSSFQMQQHPQSQSNNMADIKNRTLGFERIFSLNLPERSDKRDAQSLAASVTNISIEYIPGIKGEHVITKALPHGQEDRKMLDNMIGSWRAHMNALREIVEQGYSSVLIMEDDADWDIHIKSQLADFAHGSRFLQNQTINDPTHSPYGDGWDILWLGFCHDTIDPEDSRTYVIQNDPTIPRVEEMYINNPEMLAAWPDYSRVVHVVGEPICTYAYAVSHKGAQKLMYALSVKELKGNFDNALSWWCSGKTQNARCLSAHPSYFIHHRVVGPAGKNSDNVDTPDIEQPRTDNLRYSAQMNLEQLIMGRTDWFDQYPQPPEAQQKFTSKRT